MLISIRPNASSAFASQPVNVTHETYHNVYTYSTAKLWIAYGIAIIFTAIAALLGLIAVAASGASYSSSSNFSSTFRLATGALLSATVRDQDLDGRDPLPAHLVKAKMWPQQSLPTQAGLSSRRSQTEYIALDERQRLKSARSSVSLLRGGPDIEPPARPWSGL
jgi:hypothetical protein